MDNNRLDECLLLELPLELRGGVVCGLILLNINVRCASHGVPCSKGRS